MDLRQSRAGSWSEQKDRYNTTILSDGRRMKDVWDYPSYPFRIFKSHYGPPELPVRREGGKKIKYIAMVRNGIDVAASFTTFFSDHTEKFRSLWGGTNSFLDLIILYTILNRSLIYVCLRLRYAVRFAITHHRLSTQHPS